MNEHELQQLREDIARMRRNLAQQLTETGDIVGAIRNLDDSFYAGEHFNQQSEEDGDDYFGDIRRARSFLEVLGSDLESLRNGSKGDVNSEVAESLMVSQQRVAELEGASEAKDRNIEHLKQQLAAEKERQSEELRALRSQTSADEVNARELTGVELQLEDAKGQLGSLTWERDNLAEELQRLKERCNTAQNEKERAWAQTIALKSRLEHEQVHIAELEDGQKVTQTEVNDLKAALADAEEKNKDLAVLEVKIAELKNQLSQKDQELDATHGKLGKAEDALGDAQRNHF